MERGLEEFTVNSDISQRPRLSCERTQTHTTHTRSVCKLLASLQLKSKELVHTVTAICTNNTRLCFLQSEDNFACALVKSSKMLSQVTLLRQLWGESQCSVLTA